MDENVLMSCGLAAFLRLKKMRVIEKAVTKMTLVI